MRRTRSNGVDKKRAGLQAVDLSERTQVEYGRNEAWPSEKVGDETSEGTIVSQGKCYDGKGRFLCWFMRVK